MFPQRATAGLRRTTAELTDGNQDNGSSDNNNPVDDSPTPTQPADPVTMEISSSPSPTDLERDNFVSCLSQEVEELHYPEVRGVLQSISDKQEEIEAVEGENGKRDEDECDYLVFEIGEQKEREEGGENERGQEIERGGEEGEEGGRGETDGDDEGKEKVEGENGIRGETEGEDKGIGETEGKDGGIREIEGREEDGWREEMAGEMKDNALSDILFISGSPLCPPSSGPCVVNSDPLEQPAAATLLEAWGHDLGNRDDLSDGHLSDCLQAELAIVYSDSDAGEDQWVAFTSNQEEASGRTQDGICDGDSKEEEKGGGEVEEERKQEEDEAEIGTEDKREGEVEKEQEKRTEAGNEDEEQMMARREPLMRSPSASSTTSSLDPDRRVRLLSLLIKHFKK